MFAVDKNFWRVELSEQRMLIDCEKRICIGGETKSRYKRWNQAPTYFHGNFFLFYTIENIEKAKKQSQGKRKETEDRNATKLHGYIEFLSFQSHPHPSQKVPQKNVLYCVAPFPATFDGAER